MTIMIRTLIFSALVMTILSCGNTSASTANAATTTPAAAPTQPAATTAGPTYPSLPKERLQYLWDNCDYIDFVFFTFDFSMSQEEKSAIQSTIGGVAAEAPVIKPSCQPIGRVFFQVDGKNVEEADLIMGEGCVYYIFLQDGKHAYANMLTEKGVGFYRNIFTQLMGQ